MTTKTTTSESRRGRLLVKDDFQEIPARLLAGHLWKPVVARPWTGTDENIFVYEARALVRAVEVLSAEMNLQGCRVLCLVDNMSVALCFSRRRSK